MYKILKKKLYYAVDVKDRRRIWGNSLKDLKRQLRRDREGRLIEALTDKRDWTDEKGVIHRGYTITQIIYWD